MYDNEQEKTEYRSRDNGNVSNDGSYRYVRPESREMLYRDAQIEPCDESARMPRYYVPPVKEKTPPQPDVQAPVDRDTHEAVAPKVMRRFWVKVLCLCMVCALLGGLVGGGVTAMMIHRSHETALEEPTVTASVGGEEQSSGMALPNTPIPAHRMSPSEIYTSACQQVVGITTEVTYHNLFGMTVSQPVSGSGFFISEDGYVLTNHHVVEYAIKYNQPAKVIAHDGTHYDAAVVGYDSDNDIAVLQVDAKELDFASLGNSDTISVGDTVYAVGNPLGELQFSMTTGSVSATDRLISTQEAAPAINMFQIDAAVNEGNSGGPVYDDGGRVIGIVTAKYSEEGIEGIGFAIPINDAVTIATDLITTGYVTGKAKLGVDAQTMSARAAAYYNSVEGAYIRYIDPESCAQAAGLQLGDVIYRFGAMDVYSRDDLQAAVRSYHAGDTVEMGVYRNQQYLTIMVTLDENIPESVSHDGRSEVAPLSYQSYSSPF